MLPQRTTKRRSSKNSSQKMPKTPLTCCEKISTGTLDRLEKSRHFCLKTCEAERFSPLASRPSSDWIGDLEPSGPTTVHKMASITRPLLMAWGRESGS